jgi:hypothetical protein
MHVPQTNVTVRVKTLKSIVVTFADFSVLGRAVQRCARKNAGGTRLRSTWSDLGAKFH